MTDTTPGADREQRERALATVEFSRQTHVEWAAHLRQHPESEPSAVGDAEYHERAVREYDNVLAVLRRADQADRCPAVEPCAHFRAAIRATFAGERARAALAAARPDDDTTAALERVRALCDQWEADAKRADDAEPVTSDGLTRMILSARYLRMNAADLRAALDPQ